MVDAIFLNPFSAGSAVHRPIGTDAIYAGSSERSTLDMTSHASRVAINAPHPFGAPFRQIDPAHALVTIAWSGRGSGVGLPFSVRVPPNWPENYNLANKTRDTTAMLYDPATGLIHDFYEFNPIERTARIRRSYSIAGLGHGTSLGQRVGTTASGSSKIVGAIRAHEVNTPRLTIPHGFKIAAPYRPTNTPPLVMGMAIQAPATNGDGDASKPDYNTGVWPYGSLLAIPPQNQGGPNLEALYPPITDSELAANNEAAIIRDAVYRHAVALRDYGATIADGAGTVILNSDEVLGARGTGLRDGLRALWPHVRMVKNSVTGATATVVKAPSYTIVGNIGTMTVPAGGGTPLAPNRALDAAPPPPPPAEAAMPTLITAGAWPIVAAP